MQLHIRPVTMADYPAVALLVGLNRTRTVTADELKSSDQRRPSDYPFLRLVAEADGTVVGTATGGRLVWLKETTMTAYVGVDPAYRRRGIGRALYQELEAFFAVHRPRELSGGVLDNQPESLTWAERRGFAVKHHSFESTLDMAVFDPTPYQELVERIRAEYRIVTLAEIRSPETERRLYEAIREYDLDTPDASDYPFPTFEVWRSDFFDRPAFWPEACLIAMDRKGNWAGLTALERPSPKEPGHAITDFTGVGRAYRGQGLAQALKVISIQWAKEQGITKTSTSNHSTNQPMLAINRKLGFVPLPGYLSMMRPFGAE